MTNVRKMLAAAVLGVVLIIGVVAYNVFKTPAQASAPIQAIPLAASEATAPSATEAVEPTTADTTTTDVPTSVAAATADTEATAELPSEAPVDTTDVPVEATEPPVEAAATDTAAPDSAPAVTSEAVTLQIVQEESEARFVIDEVLNGSPKTVVGTTDQVAGEIAIDPSDPTKSRVGVIQVNARTLTTDSEFRNRAIKNQILATNAYEFITFTPSELVGLPQQGTVGESYTFQIVGDLTIRDVTQQVTFDATVTPASESRVEGTAQTTIRYADYGITIPQVRQVTGVSDDVRLEIDFVAVTS